MRDFTRRFGLESDVPSLTQPEGQATLPPGGARRATPGVGGRLRELGMSRTRSWQDSGPAVGCLSEAELVRLAHGEPPAPRAETHLSDCPACRLRLSRLRAELGVLRGLGAPGGLAGVTAATPDGRVEPDAPEYIGRYEVRRRLDRGGQASVFLAQHPTLGIDVVIKWSHNPLPADEFEGDRLVAEARALSALNHPNLARVYDLDRHDDRPFVAMEYVRGRTLAQYAGPGGSQLRRPRRPDSSRRSPAPRPRRTGWGSPTATSRRAT